MLARKFLVFISIILFGLLLIASASAGTLLSSTGKQVITSWIIPSSNNLPLWSDKELCGTCLVSPENSFLSKSSSGYHVTPNLTDTNHFGTGENSEIQILQKIWKAPADYSDTNTTGRLGNQFVKPYANASIYYPESSSASGLKSFGKGGCYLFYLGNPCQNYPAEYLPNLKQDNASGQVVYNNPDDYYRALQAYQNNLTPIQRKIDMTLLMLYIDPNYPKYENEDLSMQRAGTAIPASDLGPDGVLNGDAVNVYIDVKPGTSSNVIEPYIYGLPTRGSNSFSAIVPLKNIYALASLPQVLKITIAAPPLHGSPN
jgi:hypothetical protein